MQKTVFLLHGNDNYQSSQKLKIWQDQFVKKYGEDSNIDTYSGGKINISNFETDLRTTPFLSEKRMIIVKDFLSKGDKDDVKRITKLLDKTPDTCVLIFFESEKLSIASVAYKAINKVGKIDEFPALAQSQITNWIINKSKADGIKISYVTANYLTAHCGTNLWTISNELEKLKTFVQDKEITNEIIDELTTPSLEASIFKLTDCISEKRTQKSLDVLKILNDNGEDLTQTFFMIVRQFRILIQTKDLVDKNESMASIGKKIKQKPFVVQKAKTQIKNFTAEKLREIYEQLLQIDIGFKTGKIKIIKGDNRQYKLAIEKFIIDCCK